MLNIFLKYWKHILITGIIIISVIMNLVFINLNKQLEQDYKTSKSNEKAYIAENDSLKNQNRVFQISIREYKQSNDSIDKKLNIFLLQDL